MSLESIYNVGLDANAANYEALTPLSFAERTAHIYPEYPAIIYGALRRTWGETYERMRRVASALTARGLQKGETVSIIAANIPEMFEAHFAVPMAGAVLNTVNTRLDAEAIAFILAHAEAKVIMVDPEFADVVDRAIHMSGLTDVLVVDILDPTYEGGRRIGSLSYDDLVAEGDPE